MGAVTGVVIGGSTVIEVSIFVGAQAEKVVNPVVRMAKATNVVRERNTVAPYRRQHGVMPARRVTLSRAAQRRLQKSKTAPVASVEPLKPFLGT